MISIVRSVKRTQPGTLEAEVAALLDRPPHHPAQDVAAILVRRHDPGRDQEAHPAGVVGDDPHRPGRLRGRFVLQAAHLLGEFDQRTEQVGLVDRRDVLEDRRHALEAHSGIDVLRRERRQRAVLAQVVGHEDVVPVLEEAVAVVAGPVVGSAEVLLRGRGTSPSTGRRVRSGRPARSSPTAAA